MAEPEPTPPAEAEPATAASDSARTRRLLLLALAAVVVIALAVLLIVRPWASGAPGAAPTPSGSSSSRTPSPAPSDTPTTPVPSESAAPQPVPIESPGVITQGLTAEILGIEAVDGVAKGPGEVSGPSIRFTVTITNATSAAVDLTATVVTVDYGADRTPAGQLYQPGASPMPTSVAAGASASGVYVFTIPADQRGLVNITVDYSVGVPPLVFSGRVP